MKIRLHESKPDPILYALEKHLPTTNARLNRTIAVSITEEIETELRFRSLC